MRADKTKIKTVAVKWLMIFAILMAFSEGCGAATAGGAPAGAAREVFDKAGGAYEKGDFSAAAAGYEKLLEMGIRSGVVYYNLGNAKFKEGGPGGAIINYRRALALIPRDKEIRENLDYARTLVVDEKRVDEVRIPGPMERLSEALRLLTLDELTVAMTGALILSTLFFCIGIFVWNGIVRRVSVRLGLALLIVAAIAGAGLGLVVYEDKAAPEAVVMEERVEARSGPGESFSTVFILHEGTEVVVEKEKGEWRKVFFPTAGSGWVRATAAEKI